MENMKKIELHFDNEVDQEVTVVVEVPETVVENYGGFHSMFGHIYVAYEIENSKYYFYEDAYYDCGEGFDEYYSYTPRYFIEL